METFKLAGSRTAENLARAYAGECQARTRYLFYAEAAVKEGFPVIGRIFTETENDERGHAEAFFEYLVDGLGSGIMEPAVLVPYTQGDVSVNLSASSGLERQEWSRLYPEFGRIAGEEGFSDIARSFFSIAEVEKRHDARFAALLKNYNAGTLFSGPPDTVWQCTNCGFRHKGGEAPEKCPACRHPRKFFRAVCPEVL